jgi:hypothetical protein
MGSTSLAILFLVRLQETYFPKKKIPWIRRLNKSRFVRNCQMRRSQCVWCHPPPPPPSPRPIEFPPGDLPNRSGWRLGLNLLAAPVCMAGWGYHALTRREIIVRGQFYFSRLPKYWPPHPPLRPVSLSSPRNKGGGLHTRRAARLVGGQYFGRREK